MSDSILQVNQIKDKGGNATGITVADSSANVTIGNLTATTAAINAGTLGSSVTGNWGWKLLETQTASGSDNNLSIGSSSTITSTYTLYKIIMQDFTLQASTALLARFYISGSAASAGYDFNVYGYDCDDNRVIQNSNSQTYFYVTNIAFSPANTDNQGINAEFTLTNPSATQWHGIRWEMDFNNSNNRATRGDGTAGHRRHRESANKGPLTGLYFVTNSGTAITRGTLRLYGVINA